MSVIKILDSLTANQIAAGEVVERPSSVVKELCENSLDAGASVVSVMIKNGGISLIQVIDNGTGMEPSDVEVAFLRHSTSKLNSVMDFNNITTMGFRGEALASIAAVSRIQIKSKQIKAEQGYMAELEAGEITSKGLIGCPNGTNITVESLFFNTPARYKFLKKDSTEGSYIADIMERFVLSRPDVSFYFNNNGQEIIHSPGNNDLKSAIFSVYGKNITNSLIYVSYIDEGVTVNGFVGKPEICRKNRQHQSVFINHRYVKSNTVTAALEEAFKTLLMKGNYPFCVLNIEISPALVDVNVHPQKTQVKFSNESDVFRAVFHAVRSVISSDSSAIELKTSDDKNDITIDNTDSKRNSDVNSSTRSNDGSFSSKGNESNNSNNIDKNTYSNETKYSNNNSNNTSNNNINNNGNSNFKPGTESDISQKNAAIHYETNDSEENKLLADKGSLKSMSVKEPDKPVYNADDQNQNLQDESQQSDDLSKSEQTDYFNYVQQNGDFSKSEQTIDGSQNSLGENENSASSEQITMGKDYMSKMKFIGSLFNTYLLFEYANEMIIIDQHAAHERIIYERLLEMQENHINPAQVLLSSVIVDLTAHEVYIVDENIDLLYKLGFECESFGSQSIILRSVPLDTESIDPASAFKAVLDTISKPNLNPDKIFSEALYTVACKAAIKANDKLDPQEVFELITQMQEVDRSTHCPHGRPSIVKIPKKDVEKWFKRIVG
jgi:DNA mismatch repair protein MutL